MTYHPELVPLDGDQQGMHLSPLLKNTMLSLAPETEPHLSEADLSVSNTALLAENHRLEAEVARLHSALHTPNTASSSPSPCLESGATLPVGTLAPETDPAPASAETLEHATAHLMEDHRRLEIEVVGLREELKTKGA